MENATILILGGYGHTGHTIARFLLQETPVHLVIAGRDLDKAQICADRLNQQFLGQRVVAVQADAAAPDALAEAMKGVQLAIVASSTADFTSGVAQAALTAGVDYMDIHFGPKVYRELLRLSDEITRQGRCFISGGGFHPGIPAALIRYAATKMDNIRDAVVSGVMNIDFSNYPVTAATRREFVEELADFDMRFFRDGQWRKMNMLSYADMKQIDFGQKWGKKYCTPLFFDELGDLPRQFPTLKNMGFYIAGFNPVVDYFIFPVVMLWQKIFPGFLLDSMSKWMIWGMKTFSRPPYGYLLKLDAEGLKNNAHFRLEISLYHPEADVITAAPVVACVKQYLDGVARKTGLQLQAQLVEPVRFLQDMESMGITFDLRESNEG